MKKIILLMLVNSLLIRLQAQNFEWAKGEGQAAYDYGNGIANDNMGNVYVAGKYELNANFSGTILPQKGNHDIYVAKYSSTGSLIWIRTAGGYSGDYAHALACDGSNFVYIAGEIQGYGTTIKFVGSPITLTCKGSNDVFLAKYDLNGNLLWARQAGGYDDDEATGITYDNAGNIYVCGFFNGSATFGTTTINGHGGNDIYVAKYDMNGVFQWVRTAGSASRDEAKGIKCDADGNVYICGMYSNGTVFGSQTLVAPNGYFNSFLAKYTPDGTLSWVRTSGGDYDDLAWALTLDNSGKIYVAGEFNGFAHFDGIAIPTSGSADIFVACYDALGYIQWVRKAGGNLIDRARGIGCDGTDLYITGQFGLSAIFGPYSVTGVDSSEIFMAKINNAGNFIWVNSVGGSIDLSETLGYESGIAICAEASGNVYATGTLLNGGVFGTTSLFPYRKTDVFINKISQSNVAPACSQLNSLTVMEGQQASFNVSVTGTAPLNYQWQKNGVNIWGANAPSYTITNTQFTHAGQYRMVVTNMYGTYISNAATLTVTPFIAPPPCTSAGTITREFWANVTGNSVADVPVNTAATSISQLTDFEGPSNIANNYGSRIRGYICPPFSGNYIFWIASDNNSELWLSTDDLPANKVKIAYVTGRTLSREWTKYPSQRSSSIGLIAGSKYYIEAIHKDGKHNDNCAVGWQLPTNDMERPIPGNRLSPFEISTPAPSIQLISGWSRWKYLDNGTNQGTAWRAAAFNDETWKTGKAELGYGDGAEATVIGYGPSSTNKFITTYFRKTFNVIDKSSISGLELSLIRDDGAVVYINGIEVYRNNLTEGTVFYNTLAPAIIDMTNESIFVIANLSSTSLVNGTNLIAVEIHQNAVTSPDISFNLKLRTLNTLILGDSLQQSTILENAVEMIVYPNPNTGQFSLEFCINDLNEKIIVIEVVNSFGKVVYKKLPKKINGCVKETIDLESSLPMGVYIMKVTIDNKIQTTKMLLTK